MIRKRKYNIGYALSGGGVKGFAHAGALQALEEHGIRPDVIAGTSAGSVVAALYSAGYKPTEISEIFKEQGGFMKFASIVLPSAGLFNPDKFMHFLKKKIEAKNKNFVNIESLPIPIRVVSSDLDHGKSVVFSKGEIVPRVMASATVPIVFVPTVIDGVHYVDGGVFKNFPVSVIRRDCSKVIGINVSPLVASDYKQTILDIAQRSYEFMFRANTMLERRRCDLLVEVGDALKYGTFDLERLDDIFQLGYDAMNKAIREKKFTV